MQQKYNALLQQRNTCYLADFVDLFCSYSTKIQQNKQSNIKLKNYA